MMGNRGFYLGRPLGLVAAVFSFLLFGCFASPDYTKIACQNNQQCAPGYQCNLATKKCHLATDASSMGGAGGNSPFDGALDLGSERDLGNGAELATPIDSRNDGVNSDQARADSGMPLGFEAGSDTWIVFDLGMADALPGPEVAVPDTTNASPDGPSDLPFRADGSLDATMDGLGGGCLFACCKDSDCTGACQTCGTSHTCVPAVNQDDPNGRCMGTCDATGTCKGKKGQACTAVPGGCVSGTTCADGYCCDGACLGSCEACDRPGALGTCTPLGLGATPRSGHPACKNSVPACAGTCNGIGGSCFYNTDPCGTASCTGLTYQPAGVCNAGECQIPAPQTCQNGLTCSSNVCACVAPKTTCTGACVDTQTDPSHCGFCNHDCLGGACILGQCQPAVITASPGIVFGVDSQYVYFSTFSSPPFFTVSRIAKSASNGTATLILENGGMGPALGIIGSTLFLVGVQGVQFNCTLVGGSCESPGSPMPGRGLVPFRSPPPQNFAIQNTASMTLTISWYSTSNTWVTAYTEGIGYSSTFSDFFARGNSVYWIRHGLDSGGNPVPSEIYTTNSTDRALARLAGALTPTMTILDVNSYSVLVVDSGANSLLRVPLPLGLGGSAPQLLVASASVAAATEDTNGVYWIDSSGTVFRCIAADCATSKRVVANAQVANGPLYQDSTALYWGSTSASKIVRLAK